jgi:hypothetical protein
MPVPIPVTKILFMAILVATLIVLVNGWLLCRARSDGFIEISVARKGDAGGLKVFVMHL